MRIHRVLSAVFVLLVVVTTTGLARLDLSTISARAGVIRTLISEPGSGQVWSFFPEVEIGGQFFTPSLLWGASWGYWSASVEDPLPYSGQSHILVVRLSFLPQMVVPHWAMPLKVFGGIAEHYITLRNPSVVEATKASTVEDKYRSTTAYAGFGLYVNPSSTIRLESEAAAFLPLKVDLINQWVFKLGAVFIL